MTPIPIFIPSEPLSNLNIICPRWVEVIAGFSLGTLIVGLLWMLITISLSFISSRIDPFEKPHSYSVVVVMFGVIMIIISLVLVMLTGQKMTDI